MSHQPSRVCGLSLRISIDHVMVLIGAGLGNITIAAGGGASASAINGTNPSRDFSSRWRNQMRYSGSASGVKGRAPPAMRLSKCCWKLIIGLSGKNDGLLSMDDVGGIGRF